MTDENATYQKARSGQPLALEPRQTAMDGRRFSPSIQRNRESVADAFGKWMPVSGEVLEIASGTGEHGADLVARFEELAWTYSDIDPASQASQAAWRLASDTKRLHGPLTIDTRTPDWGAAERPAGWSGLFCANMIHIAPFETATGLIAGAGRVLKPGGRLMLYGPFSREGEIAPSNARFSADLQRRNPDWGVRDLDQDITPLAGPAGLALIDVVAMPANNLSVIFEKT